MGLHGVGLLETNFEIYKIFCFFEGLAFWERYGGIRVTYGGT